MKYVTLVRNPHSGIRLIIIQDCSTLLRNGKENVIS